MADTDMADRLLAGTNGVEPISPMVARFVKSSIAGFQHNIFEGNRVGIELVSSAHSHFAFISNKTDLMPLALISA